MPINLEASKCSQYLKALGDPTRLQIVEFLQDGPRTVTEIAEHLSTEITNASHHLHVLAHACLVVSERVGKYCYYSLPAEILHIGAGKSSNRLEFGCCRLELGRAPSRRR